MINERQAEAGADFAAVDGCFLGAGADFEVGMAFGVAFFGGGFGAALIFFGCALF